MWLQRGVGISRRLDNILFSFAFACQALPLFADLYQLAPAVPFVLLVERVCPAVKTVPVGAGCQRNLIPIAFGHAHQDAVDCAAQLGMPAGELCFQ